MISKEKLLILIEQTVKEAIIGCLNMYFDEKLKDTISFQAEKPDNLSTEDLCKRWGVCKSTIHNYVKQGVIKHIKLNRRVLFPMEEVLKAEANGFGRFNVGQR